MKEIKLTRGQTVLVDDEDFEELSKYSWHAHWHRNGRKFYARRSIWIDGKAKHVRMHRQILGLTDPKIQGDHKDGNGLNNQRSNLRTTTNQQNSFNMKSQSGCISKYKGVTWDKTHGKWQVRICINGRRKHIGLFTDEVEAAKAYDTAAIKQFGEFAKLNFPE